MKTDTGRVIPRVSVLGLSPGVRCSRVVYTCFPLERFKIPSDTVTAAAIFQESLSEAFESFVKNERSLWAAMLLCLSSLVHYGINPAFRI